MKKWVIVLSSKQAGAVRRIAERLHEKGYQALLLSDTQNDNNGSSFDCVLYTNWEKFNISALKNQLQFLNIHPEFVVNLLEDLLEYQIIIKEKLLGNLDDSLKSLARLANKRLFRKSYGLIHYYSDKLSRLDPLFVKQFPCILKPAVRSGGSIFVYTCHDISELQNRIQLLKSQHNLHEVEFIIEDYIEGTEYSLDCFLKNGKVYPCLFVEKLDFNYAENKDGLHMVSPPLHLSLKNQVEIIKQISKLSEKNQLKNAWLHVEFRVHHNTLRIIEINPRFGGRLYSSAIQYRTGLDPLNTLLSFQMDQKIEINRKNFNKDKLLFITFQENSGILSQDSNFHEIKQSKPIIDAFFIPKFRCVSYQRENFFAEFLVHAPSLNELLDLENQIRRQFQYSRVKS